MKAKAQKDAADAIAQPLEAFHSFFLDGRKFIGGERPSIADIRLAVSLEFCGRSTTRSPPGEEYMSAVESALGDAYLSRRRRCEFVGQMKDAAATA